MPASNYVKTNSGDFWLRNQSVTRPAQIWVALYQTNPSAADTGTECSGGSYARAQATFSAPSISGNQAIVQNNAQITFPELTGAAGTANYVALRDASTGGNLLFYETLPTALSLISGITPYFGTGELKVTIE